ncbi:hypothetical protein ACEWY4_009386 [Coilia grayii]|uniref:Uncharacterized protein n=1 Tax=Coilia grayii TaxID=363190 RepID=A0ABD1K6C0_9TELE
MWDALLCLVPTVLLFLTAALLHWSPVRALLERVATRVTWILWKAVYWVLELPTPTHGEWTNALRSDLTGLRLVCKPTALAHHLHLHCPTLLHPSVAAWPQGDPHLQTLASLLWPAEGPSGRGKVHFTRDHFLLSDGGIVALDWAVGLKDEPVVGARWEQHHGSCRTPGCRNSNLPILLVIPNCLGVVTAHLKQLCFLALHCGFCPVVFHRRGLGGCPLTTPRYQEFGDPKDLAQAVTYVHRRHPTAGLLAVSEGSGSGLLLSYLGEYGSSSYLTAAACISPVLHGQLWFETPLPSLYHWGALYYRKLQISRYASALRSVMDMGRLLRCRTLRDVEELMFCGSSSKPTTGAPGEAQSWAEVTKAKAKDWESYWERNEPLRDADEVAVPVLCLCSADDPLVPPLSAPLMSLFRHSPYFLLALTTRGGHCGFARSGRKVGSGGGGSHGTSTSSWSHQAVLEYFQVVGDFLKGEERGRGRRWASGQDVGGPAQGARLRSGTLLARRRRAVQAVHRKRHQSYQPSQDELPEEDLFTWNRSYTR